MTLLLPHTGWADRLTQRLFHTPKTTQIHLDPQSSYAWRQIDGKRTVLQVAALQKEHFGEEVEPLYPRLVKFFQKVESYGFVRFSNRV